MAKTQTAHIVITANAKAAVDVMKMLKDQTDIYINRLDALTQKKKQGVQLTKAEEKEAKELEKKIQALTTAQQKNQAEYRKTRDVMKNIAGSTTKDLKRAYAELAKMANSTTGEQTWRQEVLRKKMQEVKAQIDKNTGAINSMSKAQSGFGGALGTTLKNLVAYAGVFAGFNKIKSLIEGVFQSNLKLSDSLADIRKVSGLTMKDINQLYGNIAKIDTRNTIETLNELAYTGAKLGIAEHGGTQALTGFVKAAEQVQMALGEDLGEEALPALAKLTEVMGLMDRYGVEQAMQKAASSIFQLGATSTATGKNIVEFSKRLMGLANVSRISADELLAIGSAADAMGLMPEVAATAFNKLFTAVQQKHNLIEKTLDLPKGRINYWFEQGKTMNAIVEIFDAMNKRGNMNALDGVFKDLGSDGARLVAVMTTMADRVDILKKHLDTSTKAFKDGEAVIGEYMIQNETANALMERASNLWAKAFTNPEGVTMVQTLAKEWYNLSKEMTNSQATMFSLKMTIEAVALALRTVISLAPFLIKAFAWGGVLSLVRGVGFGIAALVTQLRAATGAAMTLQVALKSNWVLAGVSAVLAGMTMLYEKSQAAAQAAEAARERQAELDKQLAQSKDTIDSVARPLERYKASLDKANYSEEQRNKLLREYLAGNYQDYLDYLGIEIDKTLDLAKAYNMVVKTMKQKKAYEERESYRTEVNGTNRMDRIAAGMEFEREAKRVGLEGVDRKWIEQNQAGRTQDIYARLMKQRYGQGVVRVEGTGDLSRYYNPVTKKEVGDVDLWNAIVHFQNSYRKERNTNLYVNDMFEDMVGDYDPDAWEKAILEAQLKRKGGLSNEKPDKAAIAAAKKAAQEQKQAMRKEMQDAEQNVTGIISKLEEYYRLQEAAINEARADGELTESQTAEMVRSLNILKNETLSTARRAVTTGDTTLWDKTKKQLQSYMADTSKVSQNLLHEIVDADVQVLHTSLVKFNGTKDVYGLSAGAFFDQMNAKAAGNQREAARLRAKLFSEAEKMVQQFHFIDKANEQLQKDLEQMGFITETYEQLAARLQAGITKKPDTVLSMTSRQQQARDEMTDRFNATQGIGTAMPEDIGEWFKEFTDNGQAEWSKTLPELQKWVQNTDKYKDDIQHLYDLLKQLQRGQSISMTTEQMAPTQTEIDRAISTHISDQSAFMQMGLKFVGQGTIPYTIDITNQQEALQWLKNFATDGEGELEQWAQAFPQITDMVKRIKAAEKDGSLGEAELQSLQDAMPQIEALYMKLLNYSDNVGKTIEQQVNAMMPSRAPIGVNEMTQQYQQRRNRTESKWNEQIDQANALGGPVDENGDNASAIDLKRQRDQALIDMEYQFQQQMWQIREQMGTTVFEQYNNELAMYKNMLDKKLISERQFQQKKGQLQMKLGLNMAQQYNGMMSNMVNALQEAEIASVEAKYDAEINAAQAAGRDTTALEEQKEAEIYEVRKKYAGLELAVKISEIIASTAVAIMQAFAQLGPVGGAIAAALLTVTGAAQLAIAKAEYDKVMSSGGGGSKKSTSSSTKTKLASGMLTYDQGNADRVVSGPRRKLYDDGSVQVYDRPDAQRNRSAAASSSLYPGTDGHIYRATPQPALPDGVQLIRRPIATTVNGQPSLVAERGPEIIIGRRATRHIQMNEPGLLHHLAAINGRYRTYDQGTVPATVPLASPSGTPATSPDGSPSGDNPRVATALEQNTAMMLAMQQTIATLSQTVTTLQQRGIPAHIQKYGTGGLIDEVKSGLKFDQRYNR